MYNNAAYMYPQQQHMHHQQMQQRQQMQMHQQRQMQMQQQQRMQQQQMQHQQQQQQIYHARKQQVKEKQQQLSKKKRAVEEDDDDDDDEEYDEDEDDDDDDDDDEEKNVGGDDGDDGDDDDDESFSSLSDLLSSSASEAGSDVAGEKRAVTFNTKSKSKTKPTSNSKSKSETKQSSKASKTKTKTKIKEEEEKEDKEQEAGAQWPANAQVQAAPQVDANAVANEMQRLAVANNVVAPARIPSSALSPGEYMYNVISDVLATNNKKNFQRILARTPLPIALKYLHQIAQRAFATGNRDIHKVVVDTNKKYNIVSDVFIDSFAKGDSKSIFNAMTYLGKTVQAFNTAGAEFNTDELLKFFTPEFIAMNLIQSGNIEAYDRVMTEFKNEEIRISRGFHVAKALIAAYAGVPKFFSNQKRYTFTREIVILAICGGSTETLDYVIKKTKMSKVSHDIVLEARSCQPIPAGMMKHLVEKYNVSEMSV